MPDVSMNAGVLELLLLLPVTHTSKDGAWKYRLYLGFNVYMAEIFSMKSELRIEKQG